jgi:hypothetical protein
MPCYKPSSPGGADFKTWTGPKSDDPTTRRCNLTGKEFHIVKITNYRGSILKTEIEGKSQNKRLTFSRRQRQFTWTEQLTVGGNTFLKKSKEVRVYDKSENDEGIETQIKYNRGSSNKCITLTFKVNY